MKFDILSVSLNRAHLLEIEIINLENHEFKILDLSFSNNANLNPSKILYLARDFFDFVMMNDLTINTENNEPISDFCDRIIDVNNIDDFIDISFTSACNKMEVMPLYLDEPDHIDLLSRIFCELGNK